MLRVPLRLSASWISMSGLTPGVTRRKTFISASSPKATEELLCSPLNSVEWVDEVELVLAGAVEGEPRVGDVGARTAVGRDRRWNCSSQTWVASRSCIAS